MFKRNLTRIFILILVIVSSFSLSIFVNDRVDDYMHLTDVRSNAANNMTNDIVEIAMAAYNEKYPDYEWLLFSKPEDSYTNNSIKHAFSNALHDLYLERIDEAGVRFKVYDNGVLIGGSNYANSFASDEEIIVSRKIYIKDGDIKADDNHGLRYYDSRYSDISWLSPNFMKKIFNSKQISASYNYIYDTNINFPEGLSIEFNLSDKVAIDNDLYATLMYDSNSLMYFVVIGIAMVSFFLALIMLLIPHHLIDELHSVHFFRRIYIGPFILLYALMMFLYCSALVVLTTVIFNGGIYETMNDIFISNYSTIVLVLLFLGYILWFYLVVIGVDYIKEIFIKGIGCSLKEKTCTAAAWRFLKKVLSFDFSNRTFFRLILLIIAIYIVIVFIPNVIFYEDWVFGFIFASIFFCLIVVAMLVQYNRYRNDYEILLKNTRGVASAEFRDYNFIEINSFKEVQDELKDIREVIKYAVDEEIKSQNMKTELITNVSHDLKTPITGMRNYIELLQDPNIDETKRNEYIDIINNYNNRLSSLVGDLFEVSKVNAGEYQLKLVELDVVALIHQAIVECEDSFAERGLQTLVNSSDDKINLNLDGDKTYRIFENLLINISKYALPKTRVYIDIDQNDDYVEIVFKNISEVQINVPAEKLTERFIRGDKSRSQSGSGLGLAIVTSFTEIQNGKFTIETDGDLFKAIVKFYKNK